MMLRIQQLQKKYLFDIFMLIISVYLAIDYYYLINSGDDLVRRKIVIFVWIAAAVGWFVKLIYDMKKQKN